MKTNFEIGDVVVLRSGGPTMTVVEVNRVTGSRLVKASVPNQEFIECVCQWFKNDGSAEFQSTPPAALILASPRKADYRITSRLAPPEASETQFGGTHSYYLEANARGVLGPVGEIVAAVNEVLRASRGQP